VCLEAACEEDATTEFTHKTGVADQFFPEEVTESSLTVTAAQPRCFHMDGTHVEQKTQFIAGKLHTHSNMLLSVWYLIMYCFD